MKRSELKKMIKPLVKECVQEALFKDGILSGIISEVVQGLSNQEIIREVKQQKPRQRSTDNSAKLEELNKQKKQQLLNSKKKLLDAIGRDAYGGIDIFEDTKPLREAAKSTGPQDPLRSDGREPEDPGVDISGIVALGGKNWKAFIS